MAAPTLPHPAYVTAAEIYLRQGWTGVLPLPPGRKELRLIGYTGWDGVDPSPDRVARWVAEMPCSNIGLRMPDGVVGLDVDHYGNYRGGDTMTALAARLGPLPLTVTSSSRAPRDTVSGIRFYRVPPGRRWVDPGTGVQIIYRAWRYAVVWPSVHPEGRTYQFYSPDGVLMTGPPAVGDLPELPAAWVDEFSRERGELGPQVDDAQVAAFMENLPSGQPCLKVRAVVDRIAARTAAGDCRHDVTLSEGLALLRLDQLGLRNFDV
jgi:bifunctional DNA primase/polymerase-like protein